MRIRFAILAIILIGTMSLAGCQSLTDLAPGDGLPAQWEGEE